MGLYTLKDQTGFTPHIARLVGMMEYARFTTKKAVQDLKTEQLDHLPKGFDNTIAALLEHIAAVEAWYNKFSFEGVPNPDDDTAFMERWRAGLDLGEHVSSIRNQPLEHYLAQLDQVRAGTLKQLAQRDDAWLHTEFPFFNAEPSNHYFCWFHVLEDEVSHRGQIRLLRKNLPV